MDVVGLDAIEDVASVGSAGVDVGDGSPRQGVDLPGGVVESADATGADGNSSESGGDVAGGSDTGGGVVEAEWKVLALEAARAMDEGRYEEATALLGRAKRAGGPDSELKPMLAEAYRRARAPLDAEGEAAVKAAEKRERDAARKRAEEAKRREEELQRKAEEARQREEELQRKAEEARQKEEELQRKAEEARQKEAERRRLEELRRREAEAEAKKRGEVEARGREAMTRGLEARAARRWRDCVRELELAVGAGVATAEARRQLKYCKEQLMYE
jgi:chromosome segregation ATPase